MKYKNNAWFLFLVILALIALDQMIFTYLLKTSYFEWYFKNGAFIAAAFALVTLTWDINKNTGLVSADPRNYVGSIEQLIGAQIFAFGAIQKRNKRKAQKEGLEPILLLDDLVFLVFALLLILANVFWLAFAAPIQYFIVLLLGGPARFYLSSSVKVLARFEGSRLRTQQIPREADVPKDWMDLSIANKSVTMTYTIVALVLAVTRYFL